MKYMIYCLESYYKALINDGYLEEDPFDDTYIYYQLGIIYSNNGDYSTALKYFIEGLS